jgi:hypothetical protein
MKRGSGPGEEGLPRHDYGFDEDRNNLAKVNET